MFRHRLVQRAIAPALFVGILGAEYGTPASVLTQAVTVVLATALTVRFVGQSVRHLRLAWKVKGVLRQRVVELALTAMAVALLVSKVSVWWSQISQPATVDALDIAYRQYAGAFLVVAFLRTLAGDFPVRRLLRTLKLRPAQTVALGFAGAILAGTLLLSLPLSLHRLEDFSLLDAFFMATSAATVTGLTVYDPGTALTPFGQAVLLALIQFGGLGTMAASASLVILAGRRLRLGRAVALQESLDIETVGRVGTQIRWILGLTVIAEAAGAVALWLVWQGRPEVTAPAWAAVFHSVSAFCNAGFSLFRTSLMAFADDLVTNGIFAVLIVVGGLGTPVLTGLGHLRIGAWRRQVPLLSLHARLALLTTGVLLGAGALAFLVLEGQGAFASLDGPGRLLAAGFLSVTARTAGFNTVDTALLGPATLFFLMVLMFVGGSPGSTAGGIKTTTAATAVATLWATVKGRRRVEAFRRTIPEDHVNRALALVGISLATVAVAVPVLLATQAGDPLALTFEAMSAFGTVGLSTGLTSSLDPWGKLIIMALMFVGRTGPLTLGFALAQRAGPARVTYPPEKIMIG